jgi:hypothetical protein
MAYAWLWDNPYGLALTLSVAYYEITCWRRGFGNDAAYWLNPVSFNGPAECYASLHYPRPAVSGLRVVAGHLLGLFHVVICGPLVLGAILSCVFAVFGWQG